MNNRNRLLEVIQILYRYTDPQHQLSSKKIVAKLGEEATQSRRRTVEEDIEAIRDIGIDVCQNVETGDYYINTRTPDFIEASILAECVLNSKLFTEAKTKELIDRLTAHLSYYQKSNISNRMLYSGRVKSRNENIYYVVEQIYDAIIHNRCISFKYFSWGENCTRVYHEHGLSLTVSPYFTLFDDENYYLVGYANYDKKKKHYRIDKMETIKTLPCEREGDAVFASEKVTDYTTKHFGMFGGTQVRVNLYCKNSAYNVIYDRFGLDVNCTRADDEHFRVSVVVTQSKLFYGWLCSLADLIILEGPQDVREDYYMHLQMIMQQHIG